MTGRTVAIPLAVVVLVLMSLSPSALAVDETDSGYAISIDMVRRYKILPGDDKPYCVAEKDKFIYVTGIGNNGEVAYVFKIDKDRGYVQRVWNIKREGCLIELHDCMFVGDYLYVVGIGCARRGDTTWMYLVFNTTLGAPLLNVEENPTAKEDWVHAITSDGEYLYAVGGINGTGGYKAVMVWQWRVEKRRLDLSTVSRYTSSELYGGRPFDIEINPATNHLWVVGANRKPYEKVLMWSVAILDRDLRLIKRLDLEELQGQALTVCFDRDGYAYVGGDDAVVKMSRDGEVVTVREYRNVSFAKSLCLDGYVFMVGDVLKTNRTRHQIAVLMDTELNTLATRVLHDPTNATSSYFDIGSTAFDGSYVYVAGHEETIRYNNSFGWTVYKLSIRKDGEIVRAPPKIVTPVSPILTSGQGVAPLYVAAVAIAIALATGLAIHRYASRRRKQSKPSRKRR